MQKGARLSSLREPGGTPLGERLREVLLDGPEMTAWAEATLFAAARAELVERVIRPALERGATVVCDRYLDSSLVYQGLARGLGVDAGVRAEHGCDRRAASREDVRAAARRRRRRAPG